MQIIHPGLENQDRRYQKSKTGVSVAPTKRTDVLQAFFLSLRLFCRKGVKTGWGWEPDEDVRQQGWRDPWWWGGGPERHGEEAAPAADTLHFAAAAGAGSSLCSESLP